MAILYHTAKFNSNNGVKNVVLGQTAKFNDRQYFRLYGIQNDLIDHAHIILCTHTSVTSVTVWLL